FSAVLSITYHEVKNYLPILLTLADTLSESTAEALEGLGSDEVVVQESYAVGGEKVVSADVFDELPDGTRLAGSDRYKTNEAIIDEFGVDGNELYVATGKDYADALSGAVLAAQNESTVVLVQDDVSKVLDETLDTIADLAPRGITIFGGTDAVSDNIENKLYERLN